MLTVKAGSDLGIAAKLARRQALRTRRVRGSECRVVQVVAAPLVAVAEAAVPSDVTLTGQGGRGQRPRADSPSDTVEACATRLDLAEELESRCWVVELERMHQLDLDRLADQPVVVLEDRPDEQRLVRHLQLQRGQVALGTLLDIGLHARERRVLERHALRARAEVDRAVVVCETVAGRRCRWHLDFVQPDPRVLVGQLARACCGDIC